jgi:hypothetical protein
VELPRQLLVGQGLPGPPRLTWTFADVPDVEPTNNAPERGVRAAVI